jgi:cold shock protein
LHEVVDEPYGSYHGQCKWFNDKLGYGFITIRSDEYKGRDIFVHHSGIQPLNSDYKTLKKGEYISFNIKQGTNGLQAVSVTGIFGGTLMCDVAAEFTKCRFTGERNEYGMAPVLPPGSNQNYQGIIGYPPRRSYAGAVWPDVARC